MERPRGSGWWLKLIIVLFLINITVCAQAATTSGMLTQDETWSGTVVLTGDVTVPEGFTLTIEPGTQVIFPANADATAGGSDSARTELIINGSLIAMGTSDNEIKFTSSASTAANRDRFGISIYKPDGTLHYQAASSRLTAGEVYIVPLE